MGDTKLIIGGYTFTFTPSDIYEVASTITSEQDNQSAGATGPAGSYNYDYSGSTKIITIRGALTTASTTRVAGYSITTKLAQKQWLESMINGTQSEIELEHDYESQSVLYATGATPPYLSAFTSTKAMSSKITFRTVTGEPNKIYFNITLKVGKGV